MEDIRAEISPGQHQFKLVCETCGSLTIELPKEASPDPLSMLSCGRCGSSKGTLQSLRETSIRSDQISSI